MTTTTIHHLVHAAVRGDTTAFSALVTRHQASALAYATAVLRDEVAAQDAVQDAFLDAYLHLHQLQEPAAFPGWLRRVVFKHCDRQRRRTRPATLEHEAAASSPGPDDVLLARRDRAALLTAVEALPEHERFVVALHYLAGLPVKDIAAFLSLEVSTVKKRLFTARGRLAVLGGTMTQTLLPAKPLAPRIELFLAIRAGDVHAVRRVLTASPELLESQERWTDAEALSGGFTLAHRLTPLILAAGHGDAAMVDLLLALGAAPDGACGCDNHESALWAATRAGHTAVVTRLLAAGADVDARNAAGHTPRDLARWRADAVLDGLLAHAGGTATVALATPVSAVGVTPDGQVHTGIKAIDLWSPLRVGDVVRVHGPAETGLTVLLTELAAWVGRAGGTTVWTSWVRQPWHRRELETIAARGGADGAVHVLVARAEDERQDAVQRSLDRCAQLRATHPLVVHVIFEQEGRATDVEAAFPHLGDAATVTFVVRPWAAVTKGELAPPTPGGAHDAVICTDPRLAALGIWPAVDPLRTRTRRADPPVTARARALVTTLAQHDPDLASETTLDAARAVRVLAYTSQPFLSAWPDTAWPGVSVPAERTLADVSAIIDGTVDDVVARTLRFRGGLEPAGERSGA